MSCKEDACGCDDCKFTRAMKSLIATNPSGKSMVQNAQLVEDCIETIRELSKTREIDVSGIEKMVGDYDRMRVSLLLSLIVTDQTLDLAEAAVDSVERFAYHVLDQMKQIRKDLAEIKAEARERARKEEPKGCPISAPVSA